MICYGQQQIEAKKSLIGIMDNEKMPIDIDTFTNINDDTNAQNGGYGIYIRDWMYYYAS